jgi:hypothetical protein
MAIDRIRRAMLEDASKRIDASGIANGTVTNEEFEALNGVTGNIQAQFANKQNLLRSGSNIKTINGQSILGSGDLVIDGGQTEWGDIGGNIINQTDLVLALNAKQNLLVNQVNIKSINGISLLGSGDIVIAGGGGTVTSVGVTVPTGLSVSPATITSSGTFAITYAAGYALPTTASQANWDTAYTNRITSLTTTGSSGAATLVSNVLNIPNYGSALTGYVPYTGATTNVNLGTHQLLAARGTFANNGSTNTLTVDHTSGSGYGIIVTKGGNNEALYVNKTSGSGNAMTVVGGRTSLVDLALSSVSNAAGDFLTLNGGVVHRRTAAQVLSDISVPTPTLAQVTTAGNTTTNSVTIGGINSTADYALRVDNGAANVRLGRFRFIRSVFDPTGVAASIDFWRLGGGAEGILAFSTNSGTVGDNATERMRITTSGNVLIGTTIDSTYKLDIVGNLRTTTSSLLAGVVVQRNDTNENVIQITQATGASAAHLYSRGDGYLGWIGIRGTNGTRRFAFESNPGIDSGSHFGLVMYDSAGTNSLTNWTATRTLFTVAQTFRTNTDTYLSATSGRVGIGISPAGAKLTVLAADETSDGAIAIQTPGATYLKLGGNTTYSWIQSFNSKPLYINALGNNVVFSGGGNVLIGTTTSSTYKLDVNGTARIQGSLTATLASATTGNVIYYNTSTGLFTYGAPAATPTLAQVTTAGNTTTNSITVGSTIIQNNYPYLFIKNTSPTSPDVGIIGSVQAIAGGGGGGYGMLGIMSYNPSMQFFLSGTAGVKAELSDVLNSGSWNRTLTIRGTYPVFTFNSADAKWGAIGYDYSGGMAFWVNASTADTGAISSAMYITNAGNLGIGTTSPSYKLQVEGTTYINSYLIVSNGTAGVGMYADTVYGRGAMGTGSTIQPEGSNRNLRILTPTDGGAGEISIGYFKAPVGLYWNRALSISNAPAIPHLMLQPDSGNVVIGTTTDAGYKLYVNGDINSTAYFVNGVAGYTGMLVIPTNPPGQQNIDIQGGIIVNIF